MFQFLGPLPFAHAPTTRQIPSEPGSLVYCFPHRQTMHRTYLQKKRDSAGWHPHGFPTLQLTSEGPPKSVVHLVNGPVWADTALAAGYGPMPNRHHLVAVRMEPRERRRQSHRQRPDSLLWPAAKKQGGGILTMAAAYQPQQPEMALDSCLLLTGWNTRAEYLSSNRSRCAENSRLERHLGPYQPAPFRAQKGSSTGHLAPLHIFGGKSWLLGRAAVRRPR